MTLARRPLLALAGLGLVAGSPLARAAGPTMKGSGVAATQRREVGAFVGVGLGGPFAVVLRQGTREAIEIVADDNILALVETRLSGTGADRSLEIGLARDARIEPQTPIVVTIDYVRLEDLAVGGSGSIRAQSMKAPKLDAAIGGSGSIDLAELDVGNLAVAIGGSGAFRADGRARKLSVSIGGSGRCDAERLVERRCRRQRRRQRRHARARRNGAAGDDRGQRQRLPQRRSRPAGRHRRQRPRQADLKATPGHRPVGAACRCNQTYDAAPPRLLAVDGAGTVLPGTRSRHADIALRGPEGVARRQGQVVSEFEDTQVVAGKPDFAATAIMESIATEVNDRGQIIDRHVSDLVVTGSPAQAIREHFAATRADLETATSMITLLDPVGVWASSVVKALSDAGGRPIEKLHLREHSTLRTIAMIERTMLVRRQEDTLRIFHADVRAPGPENAEIPVALMERSQMTAVIIGPMQPHAIDALLTSLKLATSLPTWRCPHLLFQLPPNANWINAKVEAIDWPERLHVHIVSEPMTGASSVWNAMLNVWNEAKLQPGWDPAAVSPMLGTSDFPIKVGELEGGGDAGAEDHVAGQPRQRRRRNGRSASGARRRARPPGALQPAQARRLARLRAGRRRPAASSSPTKRAIRNRSTWSWRRRRAPRCSERIATPPGRWA